MQSVGYYCGYTMHLYCRFYFFDTLVEVGSYEVHYHYRIPIDYTLDGGQYRINHTIIGSTNLNLRCPTLRSTLSSSLRPHTNDQEAVNSCLQ
jgi:hypothetical protein